MEYSLRVLNEKLVEEQSALNMWNECLTHKDPVVVTMAKGNISSNTNRIKDLERGIEFIKAIVTEEKKAKFENKNVKAAE